MKILYGYVVPPFSVHDFVTVVYIEGDQCFFAQLKQHKILSFEKFDRNEFVLEQTAEFAYEKKEGDEGLYCFKTAHPPVILGEYLEVISPLIDFIRHNVVNDFALLSIARFLHFTGYRYTLVNQINHHFRSSGIASRYPFIEEEQFLPAGNHNIHVLQTIDFYKHLVVIYEDVLQWNQLLYVYNDHVFIGHHKIAYLDFTCGRYYVEDIMEHYINGLSKRERKIFSLSNRYVYKALMESTEAISAHDTWDRNAILDSYKDDSQFIPDTQPAVTNTIQKFRTYKNDIIRKKQEWAIIW